MQSLVSVLRLLESTETPMEEYKEEIVLNEGNYRDRVAEFLLNLNDTVDGNTQIGPYKIYYEPSDFYIYEDASDGFINKVVLNESFVWPRYSGTINNVKYAVYEEKHTGGGLGMPFPRTYEQEYDMFKTKGPQRFTAMTESEKQFPSVVDSVVKHIPNVKEIYFHGSRAIGKERRNSDWDILVIVDSSVVGRDYLNTVFTLQKIAKNFKNFDIQPCHENDNIARIAKEEGMLLYPTQVNEALDSSYEYRPGKNPGVFYFDTENGSEYKVQFGRAGKAAEVAFYARGKGDQHKTGLTGTGDSRKIFGTVIQIVKDYVAKNNPRLLLFTAMNNEPSRVKLYKMLASKADEALPDYTFAGALNNGSFTQFNLNHKSNPNIGTIDKIKAAGWKTLDKIVNESEDNTITLTDLYKLEKPDDNEQIWDYGTMIWDTPFEINKITPRELDWQLCHQYNVEDVEDLFDRMSEEQHEIVNNYINDPNLSNYIIVTDNGHIVDGNHRSIAAVLARKSLRYIDIGDEEEL